MGVPSIRGRRSVLVVVLIGAFALSACGSSDTTTIATPGSVGFTPTGSAGAGGPGPGATDVVPPASDGGAGTTTTLGEPTLTDASTISTVGLDTVHFGMTVAEAEQAAGTHLISDVPKSSCYIVKPESGPDGVAFLISDGRVERVDVASGPVSTRSGAKIGMTNAALKKLYPDQIEEQAGTTLVFVPKDEADAKFRIVFVTDGTTIQSYRAGRLPQVTAAAGCK